MPGSLDVVPQLIEHEVAASEGHRLAVESRMLHSRAGRYILLNHCIGDNHIGRPEQINRRDEACGVDRLCGEGRDEGIADKGHVHRPVLRDNRDGLLV